MINPAPLMLSTWSFGQRANAAAWGALSAGGNALDAVEAACRNAELDLSNHTVGVGGYPDRDGHVTLDASIMVSPARRGAVAGIRNYPNPISIARAVMDNTRHILLVGEGAENFAHAQRFEKQTLLTDAAERHWQAWRERGGVSQPVRNIEELGLEGSHDTIGVLALDTGGTLAGGCTTSGLAFKLPGRVGDSPIIGHGLYVDPAHGAAVATGHGELAMSVCATFLAVEFLSRAIEPLEAATLVLKRIAQQFELGEEDQLGLIVLRRDGTWGAASLRSGFQIAVRQCDRDELVPAQRVLLP